MNSKGISQLIIVGILAFASSSVRGDWRMWGADESHSFRSNGLGPQKPPVLLWERNPDPNGKFEMYSFIVGPENESYVCEDVFNSPTWSSVMIALDANGKERWRRPIPGIYGGLALSKTGVLYCASGQTQSAWTTDGEQRWSDGDIGWSQGPPIVDSSGIIYGNYAVHDADGNRIGMNNFPFHGSQALRPGGGLTGPVYCASGSFYYGLTAVQLTEHPDHNWYWDTLWSREGYYYTVQLMGDGTILSLADYSDYLYGLDPNGNPKPLWVKEGMRNENTLPGIAADDTIRVITAGESLYQYNLECLDKNGNRVWTVPILRSSNISRYYGLAVDADGTTYFTEGWVDHMYNAAIVAVDSNGRIAWKLVDTPKDTPLDCSNGSVILGEARRLYVVSPWSIQAFDPSCPRPGDFNCDGNVDFLDFAILASHWVNAKCSGPDWCYATDFDENTKVDSDDLKEFTDRWLKSSEAD